MSISIYIAKVSTCLCSGMYCTVELFVLYITNQIVMELSIWPTGQLGEAPNTGTLCVCVCVCDHYL